MLDSLIINHHQEQIRWFSKKGLTSSPALQIFHLHISFGLQRPLLRLSPSPRLLWNLSLRIALNQLPYPKDPPTPYKLWSYATQSSGGLISTVCSSSIWFSFDFSGFTLMIYFVILRRIISLKG